MADENELELDNAGKKKKGVRFRMIPLEDTFTLRTYNYIPYVTAEGDTSYIRSGEIIEVPDVQNYSKFEATVESTIPRGYIIPKEMKAIADHFGDTNAACQAVDAGCNVLLYHTGAFQTKVFEGLMSRWIIPPLWIALNASLI